MKLSEGKLFTIEALNRIEGFEWPEWAQLAQFDTGSKIAIFNSYIDGKAAPMHGINISQDCGGAGCLVSVTKDEFESVDGWVRNDGGEPVIYGNFDLLLDDGEILDSSDLGVDGWDWTIPCNNGSTISHWRYNKTQAQVKQPTQQPASNIETLISQHKAARLSTLEARRQLERAEAAEHNLLLSIEAWAEGNGFDIRLLDESEEKPELVITDWRDLRVGDVIWWSGDSSYAAAECNVVEVPDNYCHEFMPILVEHPVGAIEFLDTKREQWKFIRRPAK